MDHKLSASDVLAAFRHMQEQSANFNSYVISSWCDGESDDEGQALNSPRPGRGRSILGFKSVCFRTEWKAEEIYAFVQYHHISHSFESFTRHRVEEFDALYDMCSHDLLKPLDTRLKMETQFKMS